MINDFDKSSIQMVEWSCASCGCVQWMPVNLNEQLMSNHKRFYCINGHGNFYQTKTTLEEVELKLANEYSKNAQLEDLIKKLTKENERLKKSFFNKFFNKMK